MQPSMALPKVYVRQQVWIPKHSGRWARKAAHWSSQKFGWKRVADLMLSTYEEVLANAWLGTKQRCEPV